MLNPVRLLGHMVVLFLFFKGIYILFSIVVVPVCIPSNSVRGFPSLQHLLSLDNKSFLMIAILAGVRWYFIVVFISVKSVQLLSFVWIFATPWTAAHQASLSISNSQRLLKLMSIKSVMLIFYLHFSNN